MNTFFAFLTVFPGVAVVALAVPLLAIRWFVVYGDRKRTEWLLVATTLIEPAGGLAQYIANNLSSVVRHK